MATRQIGGSSVRTSFGRPIAGPPTQDDTASCRSEIITYGLSRFGEKLVAIHQWLKIIRIRSTRLNDAKTERLHRLTTGRAQDLTDQIHRSLL